MGLTMQKLPNFRELLSLVSDYDNRIVDRTINGGEITRFRDTITSFNEALCIAARYETNMLLTNKNNADNTPSSVENINNTSI